MSPSSRRLTLYPYLVYEATALDVISQRGADHFIAVPAVDEEGIETSQFRLSKHQVGLQFFGRGNLTLSQTLDYYVGAVNGNNIGTDNNKTKDLFARLAWSHKSSKGLLKIGGTGYYSGNTLDGLTTNPDTVVRYEDKLSRVGLDVQFALDKPFVNLFAQYLWCEDDNPTGFGVKAKWKGGFFQVEGKPTENLVLYGRYDRVDGDAFDDTGVSLNGVSGTIGPEDPSLWDAVIGIQYYLYDHYKLIVEYRHGEKSLDPAVQDMDHLDSIKEDAAYAGFRLVF